MAWHQARRRAPAIFFRFACVGPVRRFRFGMVKTSVLDRTPTPPVSDPMYSRTLTIALAMIEAIEGTRNLSNLDRHFLASRVLFVFSAHETVCTQSIGWLDEGAAALIDELATSAERPDRWSRVQSEAAGILADAESLCRAEMEAHEHDCRFERVSEHCYRIRSAVNGRLSRNVIHLQPITSFRYRLRTELRACINDLTSVQPKLH
jgi:hypothetical protein